MRYAYLEVNPSAWTPVVWPNPVTQQSTNFQMLLRDELPDRVEATLAQPLF